MDRSVSVLDHRQPNPAADLLPRPAVLTSSGWDGLHLELYRQPKFSTAEHEHTLHAIALGLPDAAGQMPTGYRWLDGQRQREDRPAGGVAVIPAGVGHRCSWDSGAQFVVLALEPALLHQMGQDWVQADRIELRPQFMEAGDGLLAAVLTTLKTEAELGGLGSPLLVDSLKTTLAIHLLRHYCTTRPRLASVAGGLSPGQREQVKAYVEAHLHGELTLGELAAIAGLSPAYFARLFKHSEGVTPHQYILQRRVERARFLLRHSPLGTAEIAARAGFCDQSHLTRWFKRVTGATPAQFRQG